MDNKRDNKSNTLKQAMHRFDWPKQKKAMQAKYNSLIENKT